MIKKKILNRAKKTLSTEIKEIQNLYKIFNDNFYRAVMLLSKVKGRVIITGIGKSAHIGNKIAATLTSTGTPSYFIHPTEASHGDLGGIKKNDISNASESVPGINKLPIVGKLFQGKTNSDTMSELLVFIAPRVL